MNDDDGFSLVELLVAMGLMSVVMIIVTTGLSGVYSNLNRADTTGAARDQLTSSFRRLDKELRYASWVSTPGQVNGTWYLEYATPLGCRQLVLRNGVLTMATWNLPSTTPGAPATIGTDLVQTSGIAPFTVYLPNSQPFATASPGTTGVGNDYQLAHTQVRLRFTGQIGVTSLPFDVLFTALNTSASNVFSDNGKLTANDCGKARPTV
ncbi:prepilin-type N-terminal cleavage/methylation domain-containing protein [Actinoplanes sp. TRM 88003]|uniref:Prepilin-type N-terminal cleavage/methylation domain-containing protein n=1 Tax=Paractinoplanes aksuensis TaxID=2939490 RepID=A0ABT1DE85_9ACTN|nr:prepilin-type N-terminal cleavage/methylation domain-containing protein [Actinoplanes aksuensis]MCO8269127.1 prepilin-type N-terminal cleavage/methylation domain-containing protein [Actinoplanes aksuensis]